MSCSLICRSANWRTWPSLPLSPTRNLLGAGRMTHHENPWNYPVKSHTYEEYENEYRGKMKAAGIPVEKEAP